MSNEEMEQKVTEEHPEEVVAPQEEPVVEEAEAVVDEAEAVDLTTLLAQAEKKAADNWEEVLRARAEM
ncbi:MAG TPA: nucleotide exchange factor GrpE, partial [Gammaproteobacteria bacterium]|nr:nucleotide exchange factor GrpE [Gammaproteobacteria bacterium]